MAREAGEGGGYIFWPGGGPDPGLTKGSLEMRRRIAAAMAARQRAYPKNIGEGLTYLGESIGEAGLMWRLAQQEAAYKKMVEAEAGANVPVEARAPTVTPTTPTTPPAPTEAPADPPPEAPVAPPPAPGASVFPDPPPAPVAAVEPPPAVPPNVVAEANRPVPTTSFRPPPAPVDLVTPEPPPERVASIAPAYAPPAGPTASFAARFAGAPPEADPFLPPPAPPGPLQARAAALTAPQQGPFDPEPFDQRKLITPGGPPDPAVALAPKPGDWQPEVPQTTAMPMPRPRPEGDLPAQAAMTAPPGAPGGNVQSWYNFAIRPREEGGLGLSHAQAAAKVANLQAESGPNIRPWGVVGDKGTAFGAAQWRGPRFAALQQFARERGMDHRTTEAQQAFMRHEYDTTEKGAYRRLLAAQTPEAAATAINRYYERSADTTGRREANAARLAGMLGPGGGDASVVAAVPPEAGPAQTRITVNARPPEAELPDQRDVIASVILGQQQPPPGGVQQAQASPEDVRSEALLRETMGMRRPGSPFRATASRGDIATDGPAVGLSPLGSATDTGIGNSVQQRQRIYDAVQQQQQPQGPVVPPVDPTMAAVSPPSTPTGTGSSPPTITDIPPMPPGIRPGDVLAQAAPAAPRTERPRERIPQPEDFPMSEDEKRGYRLQSRGRALEDQGLIDQGETLIKHGAGIRKQKFDTAVKDYQDRLILNRQKEIADEAWKRGEQGRQQDALKKHGEILKQQNEIADQQRFGMAPKDFFTGMEKEKQAALKQANVLTQANIAKQLMDEGIVSGFGANFRLNAAKLKAWMFNNNVEGDLATNTERVINAMKAQMSVALENLQGGDSRVSEGDVKVVQGQVAADPTLQLETMKRILAENERVARVRLGQYESKRDQYLSGHPADAMFDVPAPQTAPKPYVERLLANRDNEEAKAGFDRRFGEGAADLEIARAERAARRRKR